MSDNQKPTSISKFKARIADINGRFKSHGGVARENVKVFHYGEGGDHKYTITAIEKIAAHMATKLGQGYKLEINAKFGPLWQSGRLTDTSHDINVWDPRNEYAPKSSAVLLYDAYKSKIERFNIVAVNYGGGLGGFGKHNDCFYDCLVYAFGGKEFLPWKKPSGLKKFLYLNRDEMVKLSQIGMIEDKLNVAINITTPVEDTYYKSTKQNVSRVINITLANEHYVIDKPIKKLVTGISYKERTIIFPCGFLPEGEKFYDGKDYFTLTFDEIKELKKKPLTSKYVIVRGNYEDVEKEHKEYIDAVNELKTATNGKINFYKTGSVKVTALHLFEELNVATTQPDPISQIEARFINGCANYGMMYHREYEGEAYMGDVRSFYASIQRSQIQLPHKEGEYKNITQAEFDAYEFIPFGYYHCEVIGSHKFFMKSKENYYTSISIIFAQKLGLQVKMIVDRDINVIYYSPEKRIQSSVLFRKYVDLLYPLKQQGLKLAKDLLVYGWGSLCEAYKSRELVLNLDNENDVKKLKDDEVISDFKVLKDRDGVAYLWKLETSKPSQPFRTNYARIKGFITSQGHKCIANVMLPYIDSIVRVHTDGFISDKKLTDIEYGDGIGELKNEGYFKCCKVTGLNNIEVDCEHCEQMFQKNQLNSHMKICACKK